MFACILNKKHNVLTDYICYHLLCSCFPLRLYLLPPNTGNLTFRSALATVNLWSFIFMSMKLSAVSYYYLHMAKKCAIFKIILLTLNINMYLLLLNSECTSQQAAMTKLLRHRRLNRWIQGPKNPFRFPGRSPSSSVTTMNVITVPLCHCST
jgi:hypothetical protein